MNFLFEAFNGNQWLYFHILAVVFMKRWLNIQWILAIGIVWELIELYMDGYIVYGTKMNYFADTFGDLIVIPIIFLITYRRK